MEHREYSQEIKKRLQELAIEPLYIKRLPRSTDIIGQRYGRLVIQRPVGHAGKRLLVLCHCDCGGAKICTVDRLKSGVVSCGCRQEERAPALKQQRLIGELLRQVIKGGKL